ncbi:MAG: M50 family metallopeptidase [Clostridiales bacterium]|nr:M50 family metallopeptidase [Clostridiales bacterium]
MSRKVNIINYSLTMVITVALLLYALTLCSDVYGGEMVDAILKFAVGAIIAGVICTFAHELGHYFAGKKNGFVFSCMQVLFFRWEKVGKRVQFNFCMIGEQAGFTEMIPTNSEGMEKSFKKMTNGGIIASFIVMIIGIPSLFLTAYLPVWAFSIWSMLLTVGAYFFFGTFLPASESHTLNDGAVLYHINHKTDSSKVMINLLKIQAQLYGGKSPAEVDEGLYFDLPQLREDDLNFALLLNARYSYYLDKKDYENAKKTTERLLSLEEYLPKSYYAVFLVDALYNACTFDFDEDRADDILYEVDKYINNVNNCSNVRAKLAYLLNVRRETEGLDIFFTKAYKEAGRCQLKGLGAMEIKLLDELKQSK